jgi:hypothetical protein
MKKIINAKALRNIFSWRYLKRTLYFFLLIIGYLALVTLPNSSAQPAEPCKADLLNPRAEGLVSTGTFDVGSRFYVTNQGACIIDKGTASVTLDKFTIPSFTELKNQYYTRSKATNKKDVANYQAVFGDNTSGVYLIKGNVDINSLTTYSRSVEETKVIFIEGALNINRNIVYHSFPLDKPSGLVFIVRDNINIDESVTFIDAVLISFGEICTGTQSGICPTENIKTQTLNINGSLISLKPLDPDNSTSIKFVRDLGNNNIPAEKVNYQPKYLALLRDLMAEDLKITTEDTFFGEDQGLATLPPSPTLPPSQISEPPAAGADTEPPVWVEPQNVVATPLSSTQIVVTWGRATDNYGVDSYNLFASRSETGPFTKINTSPITAFNSSVVNLTPNTTYYFYVTAQDQATPTPNVSVQSEIAQATTLQAAGATITVNPTSVNPGQQITITWRNAPTAKATDWLALYPQGSTNKFGYLLWMYVSCGRNPTVSKTNGTCYMTLPENLPAGSYEVRYLADDSVDNIVAVSNTFTTTSSIYPLSSLSWEQIYNGWGPVEKDAEIGGSYIGDGDFISINGTYYKTGLGVHPSSGTNSEVRFNMQGKCSTLSADVGIDDSAGTNGSAVFQVFADNTKLFDSGIMRGKQTAKTLRVSLSGKQELKLIVTSSGDGSSYDHADWGDPKITCSGTPTAPKITTTTTTTSIGSVISFNWENYTMWRNYNGTEPGDRTDTEGPWEWVGLFSTGEKDPWTLADDWYGGDVGDPRYGEASKYIRRCNWDVADNRSGTSGSCTYYLAPDIPVGFYELRIYGDWGAENNTWNPTFITKTTPFYIAPQLTITKASEIFQKDTNLTLANGLTSYYKMDETAGTFVEDIVGGKNGTTMGGAPVINPGKIGLGRAMDGNNEGIRTNSGRENFITYSQGTVSLWLKPLGTAPAGTSMWAGDIVFIDDDSRSGIYRTNVSGQGDRLWFYNYDGSEDKFAVPFASNKWVHVVWMHDGGQLTAYVDNVKYGPWASGNTVCSYCNTELSFGSWTNASQSFEGQIDEVGTWNRALTTTEISDLYNAGAGNTYKETTTSPVSITGDDAFYQVRWKGMPNAKGTDWFGLYDVATVTEDDQFFQAEGTDSLADALNAYWKMDESGVNATDAISNLFGNATAGISNVAGKIGSGREFTGSSGTISVADNSMLDITGRITINAWITADSIVDWDTVVMKAGDNNWDDGYGIYYRASAGGLCGYVGDYNDKVCTEFSPTSTYKMVTFSRSDTNFKIYIDGALKKSVSSTNGATTNNGPLLIGKAPDPDGATTWDGKIDELGIWDRALSDAEVASLYNNGAGNTYLGNPNAGENLLDYRYTNCTKVSGSGMLITGFCQYAMTPDYSGTSYINSGTYETRLFADNTYSPTMAASNTVTFNQTPYSGTPISIPGKIEAENFDKGGQGVAYNDSDIKNYGNNALRAPSGVDLDSTTDTGGGANLAWLNVGEWFEYSINVTTAGSYNLDARVANAIAGGTFHIEFDGENKTGTLTIPNTGGYQTWTTVSKKGIYLTAGQHMMKIKIDTNGTSGSPGNINYIQISTPPPLSTSCASSPSGSVSGSSSVTFTATPAGGSESYAYSWSGSDGLTSFPTGSISREKWTGISSSTAISTIPLGNTPNISDTLTSFEAETNSGDNYGQRIRGYITAPATGIYTFWIASDDNGELWLSTSSNPAGKSLIASVPTWTYQRSWTDHSSQKSAQITLTQGQRYYIEALQKEANAGDHLAVGWAKPGQATTTPSEIIPGSVLSPYNAAPQIIAKAYSNPSSPTVKTATVTVTDAQNSSSQAQATCSITVNPVTVGFNPGGATLSNGLVSYWKLDEASGTRNDSVGTNHLTNSDSVSTIAGKIGNSARFSKSSFTTRLGLYRASNSSLQTGNIDYTFTAWVKMNAYTTGGVIGKGDTGATREYRLVFDGTSRHFQFVVNTSTGEKVVSTPVNSVTTGNWYFVRAYHNAATDQIGISLNNSTATTTATGGSAPTAYSSNFTIGDYNDVTGYRLDGDVDEVGFWKRNLSNQEVLDLYNGGSGNTYTSASQTITSGLVASWKMDESSGNAIDAVSSIIATPNAGTSRVSPGKLGANLINFNGSTGVATVGDNALLKGFNKFTVSAWMKLTANATGGVVANTSGGYNLWYNATSGIRAEIVKPGPAGVSIYSGSAFSTGVWKHVVMTYDQTRLRLYVDGVEVNSVAETAALAAQDTSGFRIGNFAGAFNGQIDEVAVWNRALDLSEVSYIYNGGTGRQVP